VDRFVAGPERLVFEGAPDVVAPLQQDKKARRAVVRPGGLFDTRRHLPDLTPGERAELDALTRAGRAAVEQEATEKRRACNHSEARRVEREKGIPFAAALRAVERRHHGVLLPDDALAFDDQALGVVLVRDIIADPDRYTGETLADPVEGIGYGRCKAMVMRRQEDGALFVNSFAHGGCRYDVRLDARAVEQAVRDAGKAEAVNTLVLLMPRAEIAEDERGRLVEAAADTAGVGVRAIGNRLRQETRRAKVEEARQRKQALIAEFEAAGRHVLPAPLDKDELAPTIRPLDELLARSSRTDRLFRTAAGEVARVEVRRPHGLHELAAAAPAGVQADALPPPEEPLLTVYSAPALALRIEEEVVFLAEPKGGEARPVALPVPHREAFRQMSVDGSKLPVVRSVVTAPFVLQNGDMLSGEGVDAKRELAFHIAPELRDVLPDADFITDQDVQEAYRFLVDEMLADVATDATGKAVMVAHMLSMLERLVLTERPMFIYSAGQRGSGKTTAVSMVTMAALGRRPAAASWASAEEERGKALFAALREGVAAVAFDNVPAGALLSCPHVERALTSAEITERVLCHSRREAVSTSAILSATGNNIAPKGDLASRALMVELEASRPDPENRPFRHPDPLGWVRANRRRIMVALYTILLGNPQLAVPVGQRQAETRFKVWWELVGSAVEHAARLAGVSVRFADLFRASDAGDEGANALATLLEGLEEMFPSGAAFSARDIAPKLSFGMGREEFVEALAMASGIVWPPHQTELVPKLVGKRLRVLLGRPVEVNGRLVRLRGWTDPRTKVQAYAVEPVK
jgi:hypothetical protein